MTAEPTYEYQVLDGDGMWWQYAPTKKWAEEHIIDSTARFPQRAPFRIQRRSVAPWEDVPDGE